MLAVARESGHNERYVREEMPLALFLIYKHVLHWRNGEWTIPPKASVDRQLEVLGL